MSLASIVSMDRWTSTVTPLASGSGPIASPTISTWNGAEAAADGRAVAEALAPAR